MMKNKTTEKYGKLLVFLLVLVYFTSYISRVNLGAVLVEVIAKGFADKKTASLAVVASSVTYGAGQIISGYLGDKYRPQSVIFIGFIITSLMNFGVFMIKKSAFLIPFWAVNGFAQALMWPPIMRILTQCFSGNDFKKACVKVSYASNAGTLAVYLFSPLLISLFGFKSVFLFCSIAAFAVGVIWYSIYKKISDRLPCAENETPHSREKEAELEISVNKKMVMFTLVAVMIAVAMQGALRDGITTWMPTYISETFNLAGTVSILTGVIMPIFSIITLKISEIMTTKVFKNELVCTGSIFAVSVAAAVSLSLFASKNIVLSVFLSALLIGCMHMINFVLVCVVPPYFAKQGKVSLISGIINSCTYVGSAVSTYAIAVFSENYGWNKTIMLWAIIALAGMILCFAFKGAWNKYVKNM